MRTFTFVLLVYKWSQLLVVHGDHEVINCYNRIVVCIYVGMCVHLYICMCVSMYVCMYIYVYIYAYACMYVCMYTNTLFIVKLLSESEQRSLEIHNAKEKTENEKEDLNQQVNELTRWLKSLWE